MTVTLWQEQKPERFALDAFPPDLLKKAPYPWCECLRPQAV